MPRALLNYHSIAPSILLIVMKNMNAIKPAILYGLGGIRIRNSWNSSNVDRIKKHFFQCPITILIVGQLCLLLTTLHEIESNAIILHILMLFRTRNPPWIWDYHVCSVYVKNFFSLMEKYVFNCIEFYHTIIVAWLANWH